MPPRTVTSLLLAAAFLAGCATAAPPGADAAGQIVSGPGQRAFSTRTAGSTDATTLGPFGWRGLNLNMSEPRAITTGMLGGRTGSPTPCQRWTAARAAIVSDVFISRRFGVAAIEVAQGSPVHTPEGMTIGWTLAQVTQTYPGISTALADANLRFVPVPGNDRARYRVGFDAGGRVWALTLELTTQDCYP